MGFYGFRALGFRVLGILGLGFSGLGFGLGGLRLQGLGFQALWGFYGCFDQEVFSFVPLGCVRLGFGLLNHGISP